MKDSTREILDQESKEGHNARSCKKCGARCIKKGKNWTCPRHGHVGGEVRLSDSNHG